MVWHKAVLARASVTALRCPHCGTEQARAKTRRSDRAFRCRSCHKSFTREEAEAKAARWTSSRS